MRPEHQGRRRPVPNQTPDELLRDRSRIPNVSQPRLLGQRHGPKPVQELEPERPDHPDLREMHVAVDESGEQNGVALIDDRSVRIASTNLGKSSASPNPAGIERHRPVRERLQCVLRNERIAGSMCHLGAHDRGHREAHVRPRPRRPAQRLWLPIRTLGKEMQ